MPSREEPQLFDLPLDPEPPRKRQRKGSGAKGKPGRAEPEQVELPFGAGQEPVDDEDEAPGAHLEDAHHEVEDYEEYEDEVEESLLPERVFAGLADLGVHLAILSVVAAGIGSIGIVPAWHHLPALLLFLLSFSFVYSVVPLAFWGQTPGMAWRELRSSGPDESPLTAGQAILRWVGGILTMLLAGLPLLFLFSERSLADRLSASQTDFSEGTFFRG